MLSGISPSSGRPCASAQAGVVTVPEVAEAFGCSEWTIYEGVRRGDIPKIRIGESRIVRIPRPWFDRKLAEIAASEHAP